MNIYETIYSYKYITNIDFNEFFEFSLINFITESKKTFFQHSAMTMNFKDCSSIFR